MRYIAFLRGMNLGGRRITNDELCGCFRDLGFDNVWAFIASGNVVFEASSRSRAEVARSVESGLKKAQGYEVPTFLRTAREVEGLGAADPFGAAEGALGGKLQVSLLSAAPSATQRKKALAFATEEDRLAIEGEALFWLPERRITESALDLKGVEKVLGAMTMRTHRTLQRLAKKLSER